MQKLPTFDSAKYEFTYFATIAMKNVMAVQAIENRLNLMAEVINELIGRLANKDSSVDLETFKVTFLKELATLLDQDSEFEFSNSLFDLLGAERADLRDSFQALAKRVSKIESALGHEKVEEGERFNISQNTLEAEGKCMKIVLIDNFNRDSVADVLIAENVHSGFGELIVKLLNENKGEDYYFVLKSNDYRLSRGMEDLV